MKTCVKCKTNIDDTAYDYCEECYNKYRENALVNTTDYHLLVNKDTPKEFRRKLNIGDIWINAIQCRKCDDTPRSKNRHHMVYCKCGAVAVDGGSWYCKTTGNFLQDINYMVERFDDV